MIVLLSGYGLNRYGRPYGLVLFNLHKLVGLGTLVYLGWMARQAHQGAAFSPVEVIVLVLAGLFFAATIAAGGLVSLEKPAPAAVALAHKVLPYLTAISTLSAVYLLLGRR